MSNKVTEGLVSVIIPAFNCEGTIKLCIEAVLKADYQHVEIIVVDDGSSDGTPAIVSVFTSVRYFRKPNGGSASAKNFGAERSLGEYLYFLDSDAIVGTDTISQLVAAIRRHNVEMAVGRYSTVPMNNGLIHHYKAVADYVMYIPKQYRNKPLVNGQIGGGGEMFRAEVFRALGGFSEGYRGASVEREELYLRFYDAGYRSIADARIRTRHFFPDFPELVRNYLTRIPLTLELLKGRKSPFTYISVEKAMLAPVAASLTGILALLCMTGRLPVWWAGALLALFLLFSREMAVESFRRKGILRGFKLVCIHFVICLIILYAAVTGMTKVKWKQYRQVKKHDG